MTGGSEGKEYACNVGDIDSIPGLGRSPGREWHPTPVFLPGEFHGQRRLVGYSPWGHKELDTTGQQLPKANLPVLVKANYIQVTKFKPTQTSLGKREES